MKTTRHIIIRGGDRHKRYSLSALILLACWSGISLCGGHEPGIIRLVPPGAPTEKTLFTRIDPKISGVNFVYPIQSDHALRRLYESSMGAGGTAIGDLNGDNRPDILLTSGPNANQIYIQQEPWQFVAQPFPTNAWSTGSALADIDNDGDLDAYICNYDSPNELWINNGEGQFTEQARMYGLNHTDASLMPYFCDYDRDGDLDVFVICFQLKYPGGRPPSVASRSLPDGTRVLIEPYARYFELDLKATSNPTSAPFVETGRPNRLFRNEGPGKPFTDVTETSGITPLRNFSNGAHWWDYDHDGWMDLFVANDFQDPDQLFRNQGDGTFIDVMREATPHTSFFSMGVAVGDLNNDGWLDLITADMAGSDHVREKTMMGDMSTHKNFLDRAEPRQFMRNAVYLATGTAHLQEAGYMTNLARSDWSWAVKINDFDCDGWSDVFISNGIIRNFSDSDAPRITTQMLVGRDLFDFFAQAPERREANHAWRNRGDLHFEHSAEKWGIGYEGLSYATSQGDLDQDGDLDLVVTAVGEPILLYRNNSTEGQRLTVDLRGTRSNRYGYGATARLKTSAGTLTRQLNPCSGFCSFDQPFIHFGVPADATITDLIVEWPSGIHQTVTNVEPGNHYTIQEAGKQPSTAIKTKPQFSSLPAPEVMHQEQAFDDFSLQPLLPNKLSQLGPGQAWNKDGSLAYIGGAAGQFGTMLVKRDGQFIAARFPHDADCEDQECLFFDADGDGDEDLYVVSGSYEFNKENELLRDRLYLRDKGSFTPTENLPDLRDIGSCVTAADVDGDGDTDLFVGSRVRAGAYPLSTPSHLLINDAGRFTATPLVLGMVTDAAFADVDSDGQVDLFVTREYNHPVWLKNQNGRFTPIDTPSLSTFPGWWNCVTAVDIDQDGDIDFAAGNFGLNTKYHATLDHPAELYYGAFGKDNSMMIVETVHEEKAHWPVRGRSCSSSVKPDILFSFPTYASFAKAEVNTIYDPVKLAAATKVKAAELASGLFINNGEGDFAFTPFPRIAQVAPVKDIAVADFDGDHQLDLYLVQNFFTPQRETPRLGGGLSQLLRNQGDGNFSTVPPRESGLLVTGDATSVAVVDLNNDGIRDISVTQNNGPLLWFVAQP